MGVLLQVRANILKGFESLPLLIISFIGFIAVGLGNLGLFLLFLGEVLIVPLLTELIHLFVKGVDNNGQISQIGLEPGVDFTDGALTVASFRNMYPSYWMAQIWFLFGFLLSNAVNLYVKPAASGTEDWRLIARKSKTGMLIAMTVIFAVTASIIRYYATGSENTWGMAIAALGFGGVGAGWYQLVQLCGARTSDVFGISAQELSGGASKSVMTCAYSTSGSSTT